MSRRSIPCNYCTLTFPTEEKKELHEVQCLSRPVVEGILELVEVYKEEIFYLKQEIKELRNLLNEKDGL